MWVKLKAQTLKDKLSTTSRQLPYRATNGKMYSLEFLTDNDLYVIAQYLRITKSRPSLDEIRQFLAKAGVFVDEVRLDPTKVLTSGAISPDQALEAGIEMYRAQGKSDAWIQMRVESKFKRDAFVKALGYAIAEIINRRHYAIATNDIYTGLWQRTAARLKQELSVSKNGSLRDRQPTLALYFQGIAEEASADKLGQRQELSWNEARDIIKTVSVMVGRYAKEMSEYLGKDLATGRPLLPS